MWNDIINLVENFENENILVNHIFSFIHKQDEVEATNLVKLENVYIKLSTCVFYPPQSKIIMLYLIKFYIVYMKRRQYLSFFSHRVTRNKQKVNILKCRVNAFILPLFFSYFLENKLLLIYSYKKKGVIKWSSWHIMSISCSQKLSKNRLLSLNIFTSLSK